jgi:uncharacterized membrane protein YfcA
MLSTAAFGVLVGLLLGALGAGGSVVTVPILVYALGEDVQTAAATSLLIVATTAGVGAAAHFRAGTVRLPTALALSAVAAVGSVAGSLLRPLVSGRAFLLAFAALLALVAALLWRAPRASGGALRECVLHPGLRDCGRLGVAGLAVGLLTGFFGVGGGFVIVPALVLVLAFPAGEAVGTSLVVVSLASLLALVPSLRHGSIAWAAALPFAAGGALGALAGSRVARSLPERTVRRAFAAALVGLAAFVLVQNLRPARTPVESSRSPPPPAAAAAPSAAPAPSTSCDLLAAAGGATSAGCPGEAADRAAPAVCTQRSCPLHRTP